MAEMSLPPCTACGHPAIRHDGTQWCEVSGCECQAYAGQCRTCALAALVGMGGTQPDLMECRAQPPTWRLDRDGEELAGWPAVELHDWCGHHMAGAPRRMT